MAFIPDDQIFQTGELVYIKCDVRIATGRFTAGHPFTVMPSDGRDLEGRLRLEDEAGRVVYLKPFGITHIPPNKWDRGWTR